MPTPKHHVIEVCPSTPYVQPLSKLTVDVGNIYTVPMDVTIPVTKPDSVCYVETAFVTDDENCLPILAKVECKDGILIEPFPLGYINETGEFIVTDSSDFTLNKKQTDTEQETVFATNCVETDAQYGRVVQLKQVSQYVDGVLDPSADVFYDTTVFPNADVTAIVTAPPFELASAPIRHKFDPAEVFKVGDDAAGVALPNIPDAATYAEVYIQVRDDLAPGITWSKDGTPPTDDAHEQENAGSTIKLWDRAEIDNFLAISIDDDGQIAQETSLLTVDYWNIDPHDD